MGASWSQNHQDGNDVSSWNQRQKTLTTLDTIRYGGDWWEIARYPLFWENDCERATANYVYDPIKKVIKVTNRCWRNGQIVRTRTGEARMTNMADQGKLRLNFTDGLPSGPKPRIDDPRTPLDSKNQVLESDYWVHWTDYNNYAIVGGGDGNYLWVLSRKEKMPQGDIDMIMDKVRSYGYDTDRLIASAGAVAM